MEKKAQGLPLNVIIIAILVLVVLVVLVAIFTGRIALFERGVSEQGRTELVSMRTQYGTCQPSPSREQTFLTALDQADTDQAKADLRTEFLGVISTCKGKPDKNQCTTPCVWTGG